jgi:hypothetical protein
MSSTVPVSLEGKKSTPKDEELKEKQQTEIETNALLNLGTQVPSEETTPSRDVSDIPLEKRVETHKVVQKQAISEKQRANLENARKALAEKRRREKAEGRDGAQGTPVPDYLSQFSEKMEQRFEQVMKALHDVQRIRPLETAAQNIQETSNIQEVKRVNVPTAQPDESIPVPKSTRVREDYPDIEESNFHSTVPRYAVEPDSFNYFAKKFKRTNQNIEFYDGDMRKRAQEDSTVGHRPSSTTTTSFMF